MQNNLNEHRVFFATNNKHSNSDNPSSSTLENNNLEFPVYQMALSQDQKGQLEDNRCGADNISNINISEQNISKELNYTNNLKNNTIHSGQILSSLNPTINGMCYSLEKHTKLTTDELLDEINISDDETNIEKNKLDEGEYNLQMEKINEYYDELGDGSMNKYTGTKNEIEERVNIPVPFEITPNTEFTEGGIVESVFEGDKILLKPNLVNGILDLDNIFWNLNHIAVGYLDDIVGKIDDPIYILKIFPNIEDKNLVTKGEQLYYVKAKAQIIAKRDLLKNKGCDASNAFDEEISESDREFSDDEKEYRYKQMKKKNKNNFKKPRLEDIYSSQNSEYIIKSEPIQKGINNLKSKYFAESSYNNNNISSYPVNTNNITNPIYRNNIFKPNNPLIQNPNPHFSAEYKINTNPTIFNSNINNTTPFGNFNTFTFNNNNFPGMNNITNYIRPMGINPFSPPSLNANQTFNMNFNPSNMTGNDNNVNNIFYKNNSQID